MSGEIIVHDGNAILRGSCDAVDGEFSGTLAADALDIVGSAKIRGGAISHNRVFSFSEGRRSLTFIVPPTPHATVVEVSIPFSLTAPWTLPPKKRHK